MKKSVLFRAAVLTAFATFGLTACTGGEPTSSARVVVTSNNPEALVSTTTAPSEPSEAPETAAPSESAGSAPQPPSSTSAPPARPSTPDTSVERLAAAAHLKLGRIITDGNAMTLYRLDSDQAKPVKSSCLGDCAKVFPPVSPPADGTVDVEGIDPKLVSQFTRPDGIVQLTLAGRPVYRFVGDAAPGEAFGHGIGAAFAMTPTGAKAVVKD
ncbi:MAG TPA: hypothetical protein VFV67_31025 [Actinophytocola sp.]|uniref:hypothetical protein n=1 Tax=Actinophytocola sp. TaxID=1872138 RepID=UPI002DB6A7EE|nr:hypothetical protein [Actinophytocola sp.]HEU5475100.1 hypothetical protein [Actinophytocola sp.]